MKKIILTVLAMGVVVLGFSQSNPKLVDGVVYKGKVPYTGEFTLEEDGDITSVMFVENGIRNGKIVKYYNALQKRELGQYQKGNKHGEWRMYNEDEKVVAVAFYDSGKKDGTWKVWDNNGTLRTSITYKEGQKTGKWQSWDATGELLQERDYSVPMANK